MKSSWPQAIEWILASEGAEVNISAGEPGGISKYGVSLQTFREHCKRLGLAAPTFDTIKGFTADQAASFYRAEFADKINFDALAAGPDYRLLDATVNLGIGGGLRLLSSLTGQWATVDPVALGAAAASMDPAGLAKAISNGWIAIKSQSPTWGPYVDEHGQQHSGHAHGWTNRNVAATANALSLIGG